MREVFLFRGMFVSATNSATKLAGLPNFHISNIMHLVTKFRDVEWMLKHWPMFSRLVGWNASTEAAKRLLANYLEVELRYPICLNRPTQSRDRMHVCTDTGHWLGKF